MGNIGLSELLGTLSTSLGGITVGQGLKHQTRVALVSYASNAKVIAPLTQYTSFEELIAGLSGIEATNEAEVNLLEALQTSGSLLANRTNDDDRKAVFIVVASAYSASQNDPRPLAAGLKEAGHYIMTIAMVINDEGEEQVKKLADIASPGFAFSTRDDSVVDDIALALCRANCFCPSSWMQITNASHAPTKRFGECVRLASSPASWFGASLACSKENAFLASELTKAKHDFLVDYFRNDHVSVKYHTGLSWDAQSQQYFWQEKWDGKHIPLNISGYEAWNGGSENHSGQRYAVQVQHGGEYWINVNSYSRKDSSHYFCQIDACDTDNYCASQDAATSKSHTPSSITTTTKTPTLSTETNHHHHHHLSHTPTTKMNNDTNYYTGSYVSDNANYANNSYHSYNANHAYRFSDTYHYTYAYHSDNTHDAYDSHNFCHANYSSDSNKSDLLREGTRLQSESVSLQESGVPEADGASMRGHVWPLHTADNATATADNNATTAKACTDKAPDCKQKAFLCKNAAYRKLMTKLCAATCKLC